MAFVKCLYFGQYQCEAIRLLSPSNRATVEGLRACGLGLSLFLKPYNTIIKRHGRTDPET